MAEKAVKGLKAVVALVAVLGAEASASVVYEFTDGGSGFQFTAPSFVTGNLGVTAAGLDSCVALSGSCSSVQFFSDVPVDGNPVDQLVFNRLFPGAGTLGAIYNFAPTAFDGFGTYTGTDGAILTVSAGGVPEPASWALMISGFAAVGIAARRRYRLPLTATLSGRSSPNTRW